MCIWYTCSGKIFSCYIFSDEIISWKIYSYVILIGNRLCEGIISCERLSEGVCSWYRFLTRKPVGTDAVTELSVGKISVTEAVTNTYAHFFSNDFTRYLVVFYLSTEEYFHTI